MSYPQPDFAERLDLGGKELDEALTDAYAAALRYPAEHEDLGLGKVDIAQMLATEPPPLPTGYIYFLQAEDGGPVKIGYTAGWPDARIGDLQTGHPKRLVLRSWVLGDREDEAALHRIFRSSRLKGEWFNLTPLLLGLMQAGRWSERGDP